MSAGQVTADPQTAKPSSWPTRIISAVGEALLTENWWRSAHSLAVPDTVSYLSGNRVVICNSRQPNTRDGDLTVLVASRNPAKVEVVTTGFRRLFPDTSFHFQSVGVQADSSKQPFSDAETLQGARNRLNNAWKVAETADFVVAIEGGVEWCSFAKDPQLMCFAWAVVLSKDIEGKASTAAFLLPPPLAELIAGDMEMSEADDNLFWRTNSKSTNGTVGLLTKGHVTRQAYYEHAMTMALIPFINPELFSSPCVPVIPAGALVAFE